MKKSVLVNTILAALLGLACLITVLVKVFSPAAVLPKLDVAMLAFFSLAALAVAAHETGHAIQHNEAYLPLSLRSLMAPVAQIASNVAIPLFILGLFFSYTLTQVGIYMFAAVVLFQLVTLPVEFNASSRAMAALEKYGFITAEEYPGTKSVLSAAALTYVAAVMTSILTLMRLLIISGAGRRRD